MSPFVLVGLAFGLAMDAVAAATAVSITLGDVSKRQIFRLAFHFGLFQALMPILGWLAGSRIADYIQAWDHWVAFALLAFVGGKALSNAFRDEDGNAEAGPDPTRGLSLVILSIATSIDALAVGLSFAMLGVRVWYPCLVIGLVTGALTVAAMQIGSRLGRRFEHGAQVLGGLILIGIGLNILYQHLAG